jgi:hypothetical protein
LYRSLPWLLSKSCINTVLLHKTVPYSKPCWHNTGMNEWAYVWRCLQS